MNLQRRRKKTGGRRAGTPNRYTGAFREAVTIVYSEMGGHEAFTRWAKRNKTEFYRIASRLIPVEIKDTSDQRITVIVQRDRPQPIAVTPILEALPLRSDKPNHDAV